jgi:flagellar basal-body rod protein FlgB
MGALRKGGDMSGLIDPTTSVLEQALDGLSSRQAAISSNLANIDTPGYKAQTVDFETALQREVQAATAGFGGEEAPSAGPSADMAMRTTDPRHYSSVASNLSSSTGASGSTANENLRNDSNTVDLETEMTALTETQIKYSAVSRLITGKFDQIYTVLGGH